MFLNIIGLLLSSILFFTLPCISQPKDSMLSGPAISQVIDNRVNEMTGDTKKVCIVAGIVSTKSNQVISRGHLGENNQRLPDENSVFEIGSVTKVFTALLLARMVEKKFIKFTDPVSKYLPAGTKLPSYKDHSITVLDLATHTASLPFMPTASVNSRNELYSFLANFKPERDFGTEWDYSNLGYWLLSEVLSSAAGMSYEEALQSYILKPLQLTNTGFTLTPAMKNHFASGYDNALREAAPISKTVPYSFMPAAGSLYSTVKDLMKLVKVALGYVKSELASAIASTMQFAVPIANSNKVQALGWVIMADKNDSLVYHDGNTLGFASCIMFDPVERAGIVILSNQTNSVDDIAHHFLRSSFKVKNSTLVQHKEIYIDTSELDRYTGKFDTGEEGVFKIVKTDNYLSVEAPSEWGLPVLRIHPDNPLDFFAYELPLRISFEKNSTGHFDKILIYPPRGQDPIPAIRIE